MNDPRKIAIGDYDYPLCQERIANLPLAERDGSKLLVWQAEVVQVDTFRNLARYLPAGSSIILNDSRVVEARLLFRKHTGATIEIFCLEPEGACKDLAVAYQEKKQVLWKCFVGNVASWNPLQELLMEIPSGTLSAKQLERRGDHFLIQLSWSDEQLTFAEVLHEAGAIPLPPYIKRKAEKVDAERYQTVYSRPPGSVAAPTAGLHFTPHVMRELEEKKIDKHFVTLHVGAGTFKPVKSDTLAGHEMHAEFVDVSLEFLRTLVAKMHCPVIAVGTTSLRTLESLYWIGVQIVNHPAETEPPVVSQWMPYDNPAQVSAIQAIKALISWMETKNMEVLVTKTSLLIVPGYQFRVVSVLVTNFHQPKSTLLLLIAAFIGKHWKSVYSFALEENFRFLSYGDSCLLFRQEQFPADSGSRG
jgi:S-adenosylmethionine:tRNA ribosyltransferase-isomerase